MWRLYKYFKNRFLNINLKTCVLLLILLLGFVLRARAAYTTNFWVDESLSIMTSQQVSYRDLFLQSGAYSDFHHPSLYFILLKLWISMGFFNEFWIRNLSLFFYPITFYFVYLIGKKANKYVALTASVMFLLNPQLVNLGFQARMYAVSLFACVSGIYYLLTYMDGKKKIDMILSIILISIGIYTDYLTMWLVVSLGIIAIFWCIRKNNKGVVLLKILGLIGIISFYQIWILTNALLSGASSTIGDNIPLFLNSPQYYVIEIQKVFGYFNDNLILSLIIITFLVYVFVYKIKNRHINFLKVLIILQVSLSFIFSQIFHPIFIARNMSVASILLCIVFGYVFVESIKRKQLFLTSLFIMNIALFGIGSISMFKFNYRIGLDTVTSEIRTREGLAVFMPHTYTPVLTSYYFPVGKIDTNQIVHVPDDGLITNYLDSNKVNYIFLSEPCIIDKYCIIQINFANEYCVTHDCVFFEL